MRRATALVLLAVVAPALSGCGGPAATAVRSPDPAVSRTVAVVAGENVWGDVVRQIGGDHVRVTSIISDPNTDPHEYESSPANAAALAQADLVVENGFGYDDFMTKLLAASPRTGRVVLSVQRTLGVTDPDANPHVWYDVARLPAVASAVATRLARLGPADAAAFRAGARAFTASLAPLRAEIATIRARYAGTPIAYTERVPGYLTEAAGLRLGVPAGFPRAIEDGSDPTPADTAAFDRAVTTRAVKVLLYNGQVTDDRTTALKQLATASGVPVVGGTETLPPTGRDRPPGVAAAPGP